MSETEKETLKTKLRQTYPKWRDKSIDNLADWITDLNSGKLRKEDKVPGSDGIVDFHDLIEDLRLEQFIT